MTMLPMHYLQAFSKQILCCLRPKKEQVLLDLVGFYVSYRHSYLFKIDSVFYLIYIL